MFNACQKLAIQKVRTAFRQLPVTLWTLTKNSVNANDAYGRPSSISSGSRLFSGSIAWSNIVLRLDSDGGYYKTSDVTIIMSLDEKDYLNAQNNYLVCEGVMLRMKDFKQATDTNELVVECQRLNT